MQPIYRLGERQFWGRKRENRRDTAKAESA